MKDVQQGAEQAWVGYPSSLSRTVMLAERDAFLAGYAIAEAARDQRIRDLERLLARVSPAVCSVAELVGGAIEIEPGQAVRLFDKAGRRRR